MSSAQEEADVGPVYKSNEEELDDTPKTPKSKSTFRYDYQTLPRRPREAQDGGSEEAEEEEDSLTVNGHTSVDDDIHLGNEQSSDRVAVRDPIPGVERPSSADGSLSIPDDTPSIQVSRSCALKYHIDISRARWHPHPVDVRPPPPSDAVLHPHCVHSTADFKPGFLLHQRNRLEPHLRPS